MRKILFVFDATTNAYALQNLLNHAQGTQGLPEGTRAVLGTAVEMAFPTNASFLSKLILACEERNCDYQIFEIEDQSNRNS